MALLEKNEYLARLERTKTRVHEVGIEVLVSADPANMNYLTGYDGWSFYVPQCVVVSLEAETPISIGRRMGPTRSASPIRRKMTSSPAPEAFSERSKGLNLIQAASGPPGDSGGRLSGSRFGRKDHQGGRAPFIA